MTRRRALEKISKEILNTTEPYEKEVLENVFHHIYKPTLKLFNDPIDRTRELAINLVFQYVFIYISTTVVVVYFSC